MSITVLGIESSCDDTSAAVIRDGVMLSNVIASQAVHESFGGVVPELASRAHQQNIIPVVSEAIRRAGIDKSSLDALAFTRGPGLMGSLLVGTSFAKGFASALDIPLIDVNHLQAHVMAHFIRVEGEENRQPAFPFICLLVSGGNSQIIRVDSYKIMTVIGQTIDDAAGEAFDKVARVLSLPYPGGPEIEKLAKEGKPSIEFPHPKFKGRELYFSYSGLKTAVINYVHNALQRGEEIGRADLASSFQEAAIYQMSTVATLAQKRTGLKKVAIAGGVSANKRLREVFDEIFTPSGVNVYYPKLCYCTDNAAMIGGACYFMIKKGIKESDMSLDAKANVKLG